VFTDAVFEQNGCGFHRSRPDCPRAGFGVAMRFRTNRITFRNCQAILNGADGFNVNQGSYEIRFIDCEARGNGDGGFTVAPDSSAPGHPGDKESPHNLLYTRCSASENLASGLAAYAPMENLEIVGGKFFNNGAGEGLKPESSSLADGVFVAENSHNVR